MGNLITNIGHIITALVVDVILMVLAIRGVITGDTAVTTIIAVSAFSLGGSVASSSGGTLTPGSVSAPASSPVASSTVTSPVAVAPMSINPNSTMASEVVSPTPTTTPAAVMPPTNVNPGNVV